MLTLSLLLLSLAAGIFLLIKANTLFLNKIYGLLIWLQIILTIAGIGAVGYKGIKHLTHRGGCEQKRECRIEKEIIMKGGEGHCGMNMETCAMHGCKIEGDSVVMEKEVCEQMMGKEACETMMKERGRCIVSKEECKEQCRAAGKPCCADKGPMQGEKKCDGEKKGCCKKAM